MKSITILHYPTLRRPNWILMQQAANKRNIQLISWQPEKIQLYCEDKKVYPVYNGKQVTPEIILHRTIQPFFGILLPALGYWTKKGTIVLNPLEYAIRSRDKLLTTLDLQKKHIPIIPTIGFVRSKNNIFSIFDNTQIIIKPAHGLRGKGIELFSSPKKMIIPKDRSESFLHLEHYLAQPYINTGGRDLRAFIVNGKCIALMERQAKKGEFRANLAQGGHGKKLPLTHPAINIAVAALKACNLDYGGVDMIEDKDGTFRVLEVNAWAGFVGITSVTGVDVAGAILEMALEKKGGK